MSELLDWKQPPTSLKHTFWILCELKANFYCVKPLRFGGLSVIAPSVTLIRDNDYLVCERFLGAGRFVAYGRDWIIFVEGKKRERKGGRDKGREEGSKEIMFPELYNHLAWIQLLCPICLCFLPPISLTSLYAEKCSKESSLGNLLNAVQGINIFGDLNFNNTCELTTWIWNYFIKIGVFFP